MSYNKLLYYYIFNVKFYTLEIVLRIVEERELDGFYKVIYHLFHASHFFAEKWNLKCIIKLICLAYVNDKTVINITRTYFIRLTSLTA